MALSDAPADRTGQPSKLTWTTSISAGSAVLLGALAAAQIGDPGTFALALFSGVIALTSLIADLLAPAPRRRESALAAAECFAGCLRRGRWRHAYACLHPETVGDPIEVPLMPQLRVTPAPASLATLAGFRAFWKEILRSSAATIRVPRKGLVVSLDVQGDRATGVLLLSVERSSRWTYLAFPLGLLPALIVYMINRKVFDVRCQITLFRHKSQWWILQSTVEELATGPARAVRR